MEEKETEKIFVVKFIDKDSFKNNENGKVSFLQTK